MKYYWLYFTTHNKVTRTDDIEECVSKTHPFNFIHKLRRDSETNPILENWKEISKGEYDLHKMLEKL